MTSYQYKYKKYKTKYLNLINQTGGQKKQNLISFIKNSSFEKIKEELPKILFDNVTYCDKFLGRGMMGEVIESAVGNTMNIKTGNITITIPVVIKKANEDGNFDIKTINNNLYIYSYRNLVGEAIILTYISELWHKKVSPHLPLMVGYGSCNKDNIIIDKIITERHGLDHKVKTKITGFYPDPFWHPDPEYDPNNLYFDSTLATLNALFNYIYLTRKGESVTLPNSVQCNIVELCDYLTISYLCTRDLLQKHKITLADMHPGNLFIHWLNDNSYMGDKNIGHIKTIIYKHKKHYIKIKTFGLILKVGDVGASIIVPKPNVFILGQACDLEKTYPILEHIIKPNGEIFPEIFSFILPTSLYQKTIAYKIMSTYPYSEIKHWNMPYKLLDATLSASDMLDHFSDYFVDKPVKSKDTLIIR